MRDIFKNIFTFFSKHSIGLTGFYNLVWSLAKIITGFVISLYFISLSGVWGLAAGAAKLYYFKNSKLIERKEQERLEIVVAILQIIMAISYIAFMSRTFYTEVEVHNYGKIEAIAIAAFSFLELAIAIYSLNKTRKNKNIAMMSVRSLILSTSIYAIVNTQNALLAMSGEANPIYDAVFGIVAGSFTILAAMFLIFKILLFKNKDNSQKD